MSPVLRSIIIDTPNGSLHTLLNYLESSKNVMIERKFSIRKEAEDYCRLNHVHLVFCNIEIIEKETIDIIKYLQPLSLIVCAGDWNLIEKKGFEENIFGYLAKPFSYERIMALLSRAKAYLGMTTKEAYPFKKNYVFIKSDYKTIRVDLENILYCEGLKDYSQIYLKGRPKPLVTLQNLKSLSEKLPVSDFVRVHRSYIVSMEKIDAISRNEISIGNSEIPIGDAYREKLYEMIGSNS